MSDKGKKRKWAVRIFLLLCIFFLFFTITGFFVAPPILKSVLIKKLSETLKREVSIGKIHVNPYKLTITVNGFTIKDLDKTSTLLSFEQLFVNANISSAYRRALILDEIRLKKPYIRIVRNEDETYNFSDLIAKKGQKQAQEQKPEAKKGQFFFSLNNISLTDGNIDFYDSPVKMQHTIREMNITVPFISNFPHHVKTLVEPSFSAKINDDLYSLKGTTKPFAESREAYIDIVINDLNLARYIPYSPVKMNFKLLSGLMDIAAKVSFIDYKDKPSTLVISGAIALKKIAGNDMQKKLLFRFPSSEINIKSIEPFTKTIQVSNILFKSPEVAIQRDKEGVLNLQTLIAEKKGQKKEQKQKEEAQKAPPKKQGEKSLSLVLEEVKIEKGKIHYNDLTPQEPVNLLVKNLDLKIENISLEKNNKSNLFLSFLLDKSGSVTMKGPFGINPILTDLDIDIKGINISMLQPYFTDKVRLNITGGEFSTAGRLNIAKPEKEEMGIKYNGRILISNFSSISKENADPFLNWKALSFSNVNVGHNPFFAHIDGISLADFYAKIVVNPDGTLNLQKILAEEEKTKESQTAEAQKAKEPPPEKKKKEAEKDIKIGNITLQGGTIEFIDKVINPNYSANLTEIGGKISGIALVQNQLAEVNLRGKINQFVPLEIAGKLNPAKDNMLVDLMAKFDSLDLSPMTPYSGKYIGYKIEKGKLSIDLKYLISKRQLDSQNIIFIDQLTLGEGVESPVATKLPVRLAIALLKDRNGQIKLDIPVSGSLDDPKFSIWRIVIQVLINILTKAATAPFALLGALFGGGEELSYVEFEYGNYKITEQIAKKIDTLVKALYERPSLKIEIEGHVDIEKDREALRKNAFSRKLKTQKLNEIIKKGGQAIPVDDIKIEANEYDKYLKMAYNEEKFAKPKTALGFTKTLPSSEMEKLIYTHIEIKDDDLRTLANQRSGSIKEYILKTGKVSLDRVFIIEPKSLSPEKKEKLKDSRVGFVLK